MLYVYEFQMLFSSDSQLVIIALVNRKMFLRLLVLRLRFQTVNRPTTNVQSFADYFMESGKVAVEYVHRILSKFTKFE
jgi:hypothetical protein